MKKLAGILVAVLATLSLVACQGGAASQQAQQPHYYEMEKVLALSGGDIVKLLEQDGFTFNGSYRYNSPSTTQVNKTGVETGSGWVGTPSDNLIDEECFVQLYDVNGNELDSAKASALDQIPRMRISWHDCTVDDAKGTSSKIVNTCGLSGRSGGGWILGSKDGVWSTFGKSTVNGIDGSWEVRIVSGKLGEGNSPMIMVERTPFTATWTEKSFDEAMRYYSE